MKLVITCFLLLSVSSCFKIKEETTIGASRTPIEYRWKNLSPSPSVFFATDLPEQYISDSTEMINAWNSIVPTHTFLTNAGVGPNSDYISLEATTTDRTNTIYLVKQEDMPVGSQGALAVTILMGRVNMNGQYIIEEADILIRNNASEYDRKTIIIHELGHLMGLQHVDTKTQRHLSVMYPSITIDEPKHVPTEIDKKSLTSLYNIPYGVSPSAPRKLEVKDGTGELNRMIFELGADKTCRHLLDGVLIDSHEVKL